MVVLAVIFGALALIVLFLARGHHPTLDRHWGEWCGPTETRPAQYAAAVCQ